MEPLAG